MPVFRTIGSGSGGSGGSDGGSRGKKKVGGEKSTKLISQSFNLPNGNNITAAGVKHEIYSHSLILSLSLSLSSLVFLSLYFSRFFFLIPTLWISIHAINDARYATVHAGEMGNRLRVCVAQPLRALW